MNHLPNAFFYPSRAARIALARQRYFEEGQLPTGVVSDAVFESWTRCLRLHGNPNDVATFEPVSASRTQLTLLKSRLLRQAWSDEVQRIETMLGNTSATAMLTDASGVLIGASCVGRAHERLMPVATRLGVNLSEEAVGTTAPGIASRTGRPVCVTAAEHFFDSVKTMHCAAAPIRDINGQIAGVLDLSSEQIAFSFDAAAVVGMLAGAIENRLLVTQSREHLVVRFHVSPELLDSTMVALVGIDTSGRVAWANLTARNLMGDPASLDPQAVQVHDQPAVESWTSLTTLPSSGAVPLALPSGLTVWARAEMRAPDGRRGLYAGWRAMPPSATVEDAPLALTTADEVRSHGSDKPGIDEGRGGEPDSRQAQDTKALATRPQSLRECDLALIERTIAACGGNVKDAAKRLGVSRGLIYRRRQAAKARTTTSQA